MKPTFDQPNPPAGFEWLTDAPLENTMNLPVCAGRLLRIHSAANALANPVVRDEWLSDPNTLILGGGSNILFVTERIDKVLSLANTEYGAMEAGEHIRVYADAGLGLDQWVRWTAAQGWYGLERLAEIPGTVGAAPIQNVGAYGVQLSDVLDSVELWDRRNQEYAVWGPDDCGLSYRHSRFKDEPGRWLILRVWAQLRKIAPADWPPLGYPGLQAEAESHLNPDKRDLKSLTPSELANIVTRVRLQKLPDWRSAEIGSTGSFFQNPIVSMAEAERLRNQWPQIPTYPVADTAYEKLSAGWLIEQSGWRGKTLGAVGMSAQHALVLVNLGGAKGAELWHLAQQVQSDVWQRFGVRLEPEPLILK